MEQSRDTIQAFGRELIEARQAKGVTLQQIADLTRINERYLRAMEEGDWDLLPLPYMEAFLKAYAEAAGMNVPKVLKDYREMVQREFAAENAPVGIAGLEEIPAATSAPVPVRRSRKGLGYMVAGFLFLVLLMAVYRLFFVQETAAPARSSEQQKKAVQPPDTARSRVSPDADRALQLVPESLAANQVVSPIGINLRGRAIQQCWVRLTRDGKKSPDVELAPGDTIWWRAKEEIRMKIGNAGGLELEFNGEPWGVLGPVKKVITVTITPDGIKHQVLDRAPDASGPESARERSYP